MRRSNSAGWYGKPLFRSSPFVLTLIPGPPVEVVLLEAIDIVSAFDLEPDVLNVLMSVSFEYTDGESAVLEESGPGEYGGGSLLAAAELRGLGLCDRQSTADEGVSA
jgi:hypothetical protein